MQQETVEALRVLHYRLLQGPIATEVTEVGTALDEAEPEAGAEAAEAEAAEAGAAESEAEAVAETVAVRQCVDEVLEGVDQEEEERQVQPLLRHR